MHAFKTQPENDIKTTNIVVNDLQVHHQPPSIRRQG